MQTTDHAALEALTGRARASARARMNANLHQMSDGIHRLLNATEPETYVQPHRHPAADQRETLTVLRGRGLVLVFDDAGVVTQRAELSPHGPCAVVELEPGEWHTLVALEPGTVWFEVKAGPYRAVGPEDLAPWAPGPEDSAAVATYRRSLAAPPAS